MRGQAVNEFLDDICYLDLKTWTWSRCWKFTARYDHTTWIWGDKFWVFGGLNEDMEKTSELCWLDIRGSYSFNSQFGGHNEPPQSVSRSSRFGNSPGQPITGSTGNSANSSSTANQANSLASRNPPLARSSISSLKFVAGPELPTQTVGTHFHGYSSGYLLDFVTPASVISSVDTCLCAFDLESMRWTKLAEGRDLFSQDYRWHYCAMNSDGTHAWLLGCPVPTGTGTTEEYLSDVLPIDLRKLGLLGNELSQEARDRNSQYSLPPSDVKLPSHLSGIGADLARMFDKDPSTGSGADYIVYGLIDEEDETWTADGTGDDVMEGTSDSRVSPPIHVHRLILQSRWPHFARMWNAEMREYHTGKLHLPEPYSAVRAFLYYLYTDSIAPHPTYGPSIADVAGMLVLANMYDMPRLQVLCRNRLTKELDIESAALVWERAATAGEVELKRRAANFALMYWGKVVKTSAFRNLSKDALVDLCQEVDDFGRVVMGDELEALGALEGGKNWDSIKGERKRSRATSTGVGGTEDGEADDLEEDEGMDVV